MGLIVAESISKDYQVGEVIIRALNEVSFEIEPASFVSFVGPFGKRKDNASQFDRVSRQTHGREINGCGHRCPTS